MSGWLLDTVTVSEARKETRIDPRVRAWLGSIRQEDCWLSVITLAEIRTGILRVGKRDPEFAPKLEKWYRLQVVPAFRGRLVHVDVVVAETAAEYSAAPGLSAHDALIAATAEVHGLTLSTRNVADFANTGVPVVNPWEFEERDKD